MKKLIFFLLLSHSILFSQISPANPTVKVGSSVTITAASAISCPSTGYVGTFSGCGTTSVTYNAPSSVVPAKVAQGCQVLPNDSIWFTALNNLPVAANSVADINLFNQGGVPNLSVANFIYDFGLFVSGQSTFNPITFYTFPGHTFSTYPDPQYSPWYAGSEGPLDGVSGYSNGNVADHLGTIVDPSSCTFYEYYDKYLNDTLRAVNGTTTPFVSNIESVQPYVNTSYVIPIGNVSASGVEISPMFLTGDEIENGINHTLSFTTCSACTNYSSHEWPATANLGNGATCNPCMPFGAVIHIKNSQLASLESTYCTGPSASRCDNLLAGLNVHGVMNIDIGTTGGVNTALNASLDPLNAAAMNQIDSIPINSTYWEELNLASLQLNSTSYAVTPINQVSYQGVTNSYVTPLNQAWVSVGGVIYPIAIQAVSVGMAANWPYYIPIVTGSYSVQFPAIVTGSSNTGVLWSIQSGVGSITSGGLYTPPTSVSSPTLTVLKCRAQADSNSFFFLYLNVITPASSPNVVQIDSGSASSTTDNLGYSWLADLGSENYYLTFNSTYPTGSTNYATQFGTSFWSYEENRQFIIVPNGNYTVSYMVGQNQLYPASTYASWPRGSLPQLTLVPVDIEVNGQVQQHFYDWSLATSYFYSEPTIITVPATVSNNLLETGIYAVSSDITNSAFSTQCSACSTVNYAPTANAKYVPLAGWFLTADASASSLGIDYGNAQPLLSSSINYFSVWPVDRHISLPIGPNTVSWSLVAPYPSGTTITAHDYDNGATIYLPASASYRNSDVILVKASYGSYSAQKAIPLTGGSNPRLQH